MKNILSALSLVTILAASTTAVADNGKSHDKSMKFKNEYGSLLTIIKHDEAKGSGFVSGTFITAVASADCQQVIGKPMPVKGFFTGNAIAMTVNFAECMAVVSMAGNLNGGNLDTIWIDAHQAKHPEKQEWNNKFIGHDKFKKIS